MSLPKTRFSCTTLKSIALVLMLLDHIHYFFAFTGVVPELFSMLGRLSAPLFLFCTVEGFAHTHDRKRYFLRIWAIGAGMAAIEFFMMYGGLLRRGDGFYPQNAIFQALTLLCIVWQGIDWLRAKRYVRGAAAILGVFLWPFVVSALLVAVPQISQQPAGSSIVAFLITSPLPMWSGITDGGWGLSAGRRTAVSAAGAPGIAGDSLGRKQLFVGFCVAVDDAAQPAGVCTGPDADDLLRVDGDRSCGADAAVQRPAGQRA